jgi:xanthine dehydrogenase accessory factor
MTPEMLAALLEARAARRVVVLATRLPDGAQMLLPDPAAPDAVQAEAAMAAQRDQASIVTCDGADWFLHPHAPAPRLFIVGAVHVAQALAPMAATAGFDVTVIDPRRGFATPERFAGVTLNGQWPDDAVRALAPDSRSAVVTLTHDPKLDDPALDQALRSDAFFIGALGSRKTHAARLQRLAALGHGADATARIRGPVGLPIGAVTAAEIAVSVLAQMIAVRRNEPA